MRLLPPRPPLRWLDESCLTSEASLKVHVDSVFDIPKRSGPLASTSRAASTLGVQIDNEKISTHLV